MTSVDTNNVEKKQFVLPEKSSEKTFFSPIWGVIGLQMQDEPEQTSPSRLACKKMVVDAVGWSQGAQNAEK